MASEDQKSDFKQKTLHGNWTVDDISLIPNYDSLIKQDIIIKISFEGIVSFKVIKDRRVIKSRGKYYIPKKPHPDHERTIITFYKLNSDNIKSFICRSIFPTEEIKAFCINTLIDSCEKQIATRRAEAAKSDSKK